MGNFSSSARCLHDDHDVLEDYEDDTGLEDTITNLLQGIATDAAAIVEACRALEPSPLDSISRFVRGIHLRVQHLDSHTLAWPVVQSVRRSMSEGRNALELDGRQHIVDAITSTELLEADNLVRPTLQNNLENWCEDLRTQMKWIEHGPRPEVSAQHSLVKKRYALVIGNEDYDAPNKLTCCVNDAQLMRKELSARGFDVTYRTDLSYSKLESCIREFVDKFAKRQKRRGAEPEILLVYYSGHGSQHRETQTPYAIGIERGSQDVVSLDMWTNFVKRADAVSNEATSNAIILLMDACLDYGEPDYACFDRCMRSLLSPNSCISMMSRLSQHAYHSARNCATMNAGSETSSCEEGASSASTGSCVLSRENNLVIAAHACSPGESAIESESQDERGATYKGTVSAWTATLVESMAREESVRSRPRGDIHYILARSADLMEEDDAPEPYALWKPGANMSTVSIARLEDPPVPRYWNMPKLATRLTKGLYSFTGHELVNRNDRYAWRQHMSYNIAAARAETSSMSTDSVHGQQKSVLSSQFWPVTDGIFGAKGPIHLQTPPAGATRVVIWQDGSVADSLQPGDKNYAVFGPSAHVTTLSNMRFEGGVIVFYGKGCEGSLRNVALLNTAIVVLQGASVTLSDCNAKSSDAVCLLASGKGTKVRATGCSLSGGVHSVAVHDGAFFEGVDVHIANSKMAGIEVQGSGSKAKLKGTFERLSSLRRIGSARTGSRNGAVLVHNGGEVHLSAVDIQGVRGTGVIVRGKDSRVLARRVIVSHCTMHGFAMLCAEGLHAILNEVRVVSCGMYDSKGSGVFVSGQEVVRREACAKHEWRRPPVVKLKNCSVLRNMFGVFVSHAAAARLENVVSGQNTVAGYKCQMLGSKLIMYSSYSLGERPHEFIPVDRCGILQKHSCNF